MRLIGAWLKRIDKLLGRLMMRDCEAEAFPDLDHFVYEIAIPSPTSCLTAGRKLQECERRLAVYRWAEWRVDPRTAQNRVLLNDAVSAFLLTFEATLQFVQDHFSKMKLKPGFGDWLKDVPQNDLLVRGIRTLRHFEAHVEHKPPPRRINLVIGDSLCNETSEGSRIM